MNDAKIIARYISDCARAKDGRARFLNEKACFAALWPSTTTTIAFMTAQAARRVGEAIAKAAA